MKQLIAAILAAAGFSGCQSSRSSDGDPQFVFVKIPESLPPLDREEKYGDPLDEVLKKAGVGEVTGGGSSLSAPDSDGQRRIDWIGIDVDLSDFGKGMPILKRELLKLGAAPESVLEYQRNGKQFADRLK